MSQYITLFNKLSINSNPLSVTFKISQFTYAPIIAHLDLNEQSEKN